ncbi:MAG: hypothetical protein ABII12_06060 [Planctomycetota bacterium]
MTKRLLLLIPAVAVILVLTLNAAFAEDANEGPCEDAPKMIREVFVPFEDLNILLGTQSRRVLLSRTEYEELAARAKRSHKDRAPRDAVVVSAEYEGIVESQRARMTGTLIVDVLEDSLHAVGLPLEGVGLRGATLDGNGAPIGLADDGRMVLFVEGKGQHRLVLEIVVPLETTAARQSLRFHVPTPGATALRLTVPGDVEVKDGAKVISRVFDEASGVTRFELAPQRAEVSLVMTLNSRLKRVGRVVIARSVLVDEVTEAYERLHLTCSMTILHRAVDGFQFAVPAGFEITHVRSPQLARWGMPVVDGRKTLDVHLREATNETVVIDVSAVRTKPELGSWSLPVIEPLDVAGQSMVVGVLIEDRLKAASIEANRLIPINTNVLTEALPRTVFDVEPGSPQVRPILAYYAPQADFSLAAKFERQPARLLVTTNVLLVLKEGGQQVRGGFTLLPDAERLFEFDALVPAGWQVTEVTAADGSVLSIERYAAAEESSRIHVRLPQGVLPGRQCRVYFQAECTPSGWLGDWSATPVEFPVFAVAGATREEGAIAVAAQDDMTVHPETLARLTPLDENEKGDFGLAGVGTNLAYRFDGPTYKAALIARRAIPRLTARSYSFFSIESDVLTAHYEIAYEVENARTRRLQLLLDNATPAALSIRGLDGVGLKEYGSEPAGDMRRWTVLLAEGRRGTIRLAVDFQQPLSDQPARRPQGADATLDHKDLVLPVVLAEGVVYQSGIVCVEGGAEQDVQVSCALRKVDIGELVDAEYQPGKRLLGTYGFVGAAPEVKISAVRRPICALPPVIVERAELVTMLSVDGLAQTAARYRLRTKAAFLGVQLPPDSTLWSAELDGRPAKPQREGEKLLLSLPATTEGALRDLRVVYETAVRPVAFLADVDLAAPTLWLRAKGDGAGREVPVADLLWHLHLPTGTRVVRTGGTVVTNQVALPEPAIAAVGELLYRLSGGLHFFYILPSLSRARQISELTMDYPARTAAARAPSAGAFRSPAEESVEALKAVGYAGDEARQTPARAGGRVRPTDVSSEAEQVVAGVDVAAATEQPEKPFVTPKKPTAKGGWAMRGIRSLKIDLEATGDRQITFQSLGDDPRLVVTLTNERRFDALGWVLALVLGLVGVSWTNRPVRKKALYLVTIALVTTLLPLVVLLPEMTLLCNMCFYAACLLVPWYLVAGMVKLWLKKCAGRDSRTSGRSRVPVAATAGAVVLSVLVNVQAAEAEPPSDATPPIVVQVVEPPPPVVVPEDVIILPYDPDAPATHTGIPDADQLLVPYDRFVELWNQAYPEKRIEAKEPPAPYALAGASFSTVLEGEESLLLEGFLDFEIYAGGHVTVPLRIEGGVLARADLDGQPARLGVAEGGCEKGFSHEQRVASNQSSVASSTPDSLLVLYASGKGRHRLELAVRMSLDHCGGWRVATGRLPAAPAIGLLIRVPDAGTEVRLSRVSDRRSYVTQQAGELIETAPGADGAFTVQWRPKVSDGWVDQSVIVASDAVLDVQEDGLRSVWHVSMQFRNDEREFFSLRVPRGYLVAKVGGDNVRGWEVRPAEDHQRVVVSLLNPAKGREDLTVHLRQDGRVGEGSLSEFDVPTVRVDGAALHRGELVIRRSPLLDVRTVSTVGVTRSNIPETIEYGSEGEGRSPLGIRPHAAYRFAAMPCSVRLSASPVRSVMSADVQALLRIAGWERGLEVRFNLHVRNGRRHHFDLLLPAGMDVEHVAAPGTFEWAITQTDDQTRLSIHLATGRIGEVPVVVVGTLDRVEQGTAVHLPKLAVLDAEHQQGDIVVQVEPSFDVRATDLHECESVLLERVYGWLNAGQRGTARLALHYSSPDYRGVLRLSARRPAVSCETITNVRVTDRALEESILLDFSIQSAGIRELSFLLPASMKDARISVPLLRQKTVEPGPMEPAPMVRVRLTLQDDVMGELRVLVEDDRLLTRDVHTAPIPIVETGSTNHRYAVLESAGRDEVVVEKHDGLEIVSRQQKEWRSLVGILGSGLTEAYLVNSGEQEPLLSFKVKDRETVETVGARIGFAHTLLVLDVNGTYRAAHTYRMHNTTEQYLEVELPSGARLWTAQVAGEPVKPAEARSPAKPGYVRIPLVKTAAGDLDYAVLLKYAGKLPALGRLSSVELPLLRSTNIKPELSQVRLCLPEGYHWFNFDGTMRMMEGEGDLAAGYVSYQTKLAERLSQTMRSADSFAQLRAASNLGRLKDDIRAYQFQSAPPSLGANEELREAWASNARILQDAEEQVRTVEQTMGQEVARTNRESLYGLFQQQEASRSRDAVKNLDLNFDEASMPEADRDGVDDEQFDRSWLASNGLGSTTAERKLGEMEEDQPPLGKKAGELAGGRGGPRSSGRRAKPAAPNVVQSQEVLGSPDADDLEVVREALDKEARRRGAAQQTVERYQAVLKERQAEGKREGAYSPPSGRVAVQSLGRGPGGRGGMVRADQAVALRTGLASLDVEIPTRGTVYRFTTPRGETEIRARAISRPLLANLKLLGITALIAAALFRVYRLVRREDFLAKYARTLTTTMMILGFISITVGLLPIAGLALVIGSLAWKIRTALNSRRVAQATG